MNFGGSSVSTSTPSQGAGITDAHNTHLALAFVPGTGIQILGLVAQALTH